MNLKRSTLRLNKLFKLIFQTGTILMPGILRFMTLSRFFYFCVKRVVQHENAAMTLRLKLAALFLNLRLSKRFFKKTKGNTLCERYQTDGLS